MTFKHSNKSPVLYLAAIILAVVIGCGSIALAIGYWRAVELLEAARLEDCGGLAGSLVYAQSPLLMAGQQLTPAEVGERLWASGYRAGDGIEAMTFRLSDAVLIFAPRDGESVTVAFAQERTRIARINTLQGEVSRLALDPPMLAGYVKTRRDGGEVVMRVSRRPLGADEINPSPLRDAILAVEDRRFLRHGGFDYFGVLRSLWRDRGEGGSTITNQTVKNLILRDHRKLYSRKLAEAFLTLALEARYSKDQILTWYSNNIYLGDFGGENLFGFGAAISALFDKQSPRDLTIEEAALLAGWLHRPAYYARALREGDSEVLRERRNYVLDAMGALYPEKYSPQTISQAKASPFIPPEPAKRRGAEIEPRYFLGWAENQKDSAPADWSAEGLQIETTIDVDLQRAAETAALNQLSRLDQNGVALDVAVCAIEADTGHVVAMVGGRDYSQSQFNRAASARRSPGSTIKPFVYLKAIERGVLAGQPFTAATVLDPALVRIKGKAIDHSGRAARAREALAASYNAAAVLAARSVGLPETQRFLATVTGSRPEFSELMAIGGVAGSETTLLDLASAYTIFANGGTQAAPAPVRTASVYKQPLRLETTEPSRVIGEDAAWIVMQMLASVIGDGADGGAGTARGARGMAGLDGSVFLFGKTGTAERADLWMVGGTRRLIVAVWVGDDGNRQLLMRDGYSASQAALPIWAEVFKAVAKYRPDYLASAGNRPSGVRSLVIDPSTGREAATGITEFFIDGRLPPGAHAPLQ
jgi:penicillin-binding protein 1A